MPGRLTILAALLVLTAPAFAADIVPKDATLERLWYEGDFTEGVAAGPDGAIYFSDIYFTGASADKPAGRILKFDPKTNKTTVHCPDSGQSNGLMFDAKGRLIAACGANFGKQALCHITPAGKVKVLVDKFRGKKFLSPNDLVILPNGSIYFSDPRYVGPEPLEIDHMSVYRYDPDGSIHRATTNIRKPNGVIVSPDAKTLYVAETDNGSDGRNPDAKPGPRRMTLNAFPIKPDGSLGKKTVLVNFGQELGIDGMTVDTHGNIYAAVRSEPRHGIVVFSPKGKELGDVPMQDLPTNCCFGIGTQSSTLYVSGGKALYRVKLNATGYHPSRS